MGFHVLRFWNDFLLKLNQILHPYLLKYLPLYKKFGISVNFSSERFCKHLYGKSTRFQPLNSVLQLFQYLIQNGSIWFKNHVTEKERPTKMFQLGYNYLYFRLMGNGIDDFNKHKEIMI